MIFQSGQLVKYHNNFEMIVIPLEDVEGKGHEVKAFIVSSNLPYPDWNAPQVRRISFGDHWAVLK